jgi:hypothetical protein
MEKVISNKGNFKAPHLGAGVRFCWRSITIEKDRNKNSFTAKHSSFKKI